jgi:uncharacterized protein (TIGR02246 family)
MIDRAIFALTFVSALGCGLIGGTFFAFSAFVMKALARLPAPQGIAAMQSINVAVLNRLFFTVFFGTAAGCILLAVRAVLVWNTRGAGYMFVGCALYFVGTILVTIVCNVPLNNALAAVDPASADGASTWANYLKAWTAWNHVRTVAAVAAAAMFSVALWRASSSPDLARFKISSPMPSASLPNKPEEWPGMFTQYFNAGDLDAVMTLYEPEARFTTKSGEILIGREQIRKVLGALIEAKTRFHSRRVRAVAVGDIAQLYTDFEGTTVDASGKTIEISNKAIEVLRRQLDGSWKLIVGDPNGRE